MDNVVLVIVDGSVIGASTGPMGWAVKIIDGDDHRLEYGWQLGFWGNNEAELFAILMGLLLTPPGRQALLWSDSKTALKWINGMPARKYLARSIKRAIFDVIYHSNLSFQYDRIKGHHTNVIHNECHTWAYKMAQEAYDHAYR